jgi:hypothetical protein
MRDGQPEMLAKVVSVRRAGNGNGKKAGAADSTEQAVAVHFTLPFRPAANGNGHAKERERRNAPRRSLAIPVRVRPEHIPWFEEAMTMDISAQGLRFLSSREYQQGERLLVSFAPAASAPWPTGSETAVCVLRSEPMPDSATLAIAISRVL